MFSLRRSLLKRLSLIGFLAILLVCFPVLNAEAASLYHTHSDSCYETVQKYCDNHSVKIVSKTANLKCSHCETNIYNVSATEYIDVCGNGLKDNQSIRIETYCTNCGERLVHASGASTGGHYYSDTVLKCSYPEGTPLAEVSLKKGTDDWTVGPVELILSTTANSDGVDFSIQWDGGLGSGRKVSVTQNGTYTVEVGASGCPPVTLSATVDNIDLVAPSLSVKKSTEAWSESGITLTALAEDRESGLADAAYSLNGGEYGSSADFKITANGTYIVSVRDKVGNVATETVSVSNIGRDPQVVAAEQAAIKKAETEKAAAIAAAEQAAREKAEAEAAASKAAQEKAKAEKEKAQAEKEKALAEKEKALAEKEKAEAELKKAELEKKEEDRGEDTGTNIEVVNGTEAEGMSDSVNENGEGSGISDAPEEDGIMIPVVEETDAPIETLAEDTGKDMEADEESAPKPVEVMVSEPDTEAWYEGVNGNMYGKKISSDSSGISGITILKAGVSLAVIGLLILSLFSYVCVSENGKKKIVSRVKIKKEDKRIIVVIPEQKLKQGERYSIYISFWKSSNRDNLPIYVMVGDSENVINVDEGKTFVY